MGLRSKIGKEQRESKRLSGLVSITAQEKAQLKDSMWNDQLTAKTLLIVPSELAHTESAHKEAVLELDRMKEEMEEMERERSQMIAEVEAQIERALVSIAFSDVGSEDGSSSRRESVSSSRPSSLAGSEHSQPLRSFGTATTLADDGLADSHPLGDESNLTIGPMATVKEVDDEDLLEPEPELEKEKALPEKVLHRFSATRHESHLDGLNAVDLGISERSDAVAQKMIQIQHKVRTCVTCASYTMLIHFLPKLQSARLSEAKDAALEEAYARPHTSYSKQPSIEDFAAARARLRSRRPSDISTSTTPRPSYVDVTPLASPRPESESGNTHSRRTSKDSTRVRGVRQNSNTTLAGRRTPTAPSQTPTSASTLPSLATSTISTDESDDWQSAYSTPESDSTPVETYNPDFEHRGSLDRRRLTGSPSIPPKSRDRASSGATARERIRV